MPGQEQPSKHRTAIDMTKPIEATPPDPDPTPSTPPPARRDDSSRYARRSAHLPHLGDAADHEIIEEMEELRRVAVPHRRRARVTPR
jgi:hypothetical protein